MIEIMLSLIAPVIVERLMIGEWWCLKKITSLSVCLLDKQVDRFFELLQYGAYSHALNSFWYTRAAESDNQSYEKPLNIMSIKAFHGDCLSILAKTAMGLILLGQRVEAELHQSTLIL